MSKALLDNGQQGESHYESKCAGQCRGGVNIPKETACPPENVADLWRVLGPR